MNENKTNINWYPGHMAKTKRLIKEKYELIDIVYEVIDARMPKSSKIKDIDELLKNKPSINGVVLEGNVTLDKLGIQSSKDMDRFVEDSELIDLIPSEYVTEDELLRDVYTKEEVKNMIEDAGSDSWIDV